MGNKADIEGRLVVGGGGAVGTWKSSAVIMFPLMLAHFMSYLYRTVNAIVYPSLSQELDLAASQIGLLTSVYFLMFAVAQLPIGVALDRYGPRRLQIPLLIVAALGAVGFSCASNMMELVFARGMIGLGVAGCLMAAIKAGTLWFPPERLPLVTAVLLSVGGVGAMISTLPMHTLIDIVGWRYAFLVLAAVTLLVVVFIFLGVPDTHGHPKSNIVDMCLAIKQLYSSWFFWRLVLHSVIAHAAYMAIQGLWLGPWLKDIAGFSQSEISYTLLYSTVAMFLGVLG